MDQILVVNGPSYAKALQGLGTFVTNPSVFFSQPKNYSLVLFTGGEDVTPELYGETSPLRLCGNSWHRDKEERAIFKVAQQAGVPCAGICRGVQFLNVMCGGKLFHHISGHGGVHHPAETRFGNIIEVNSYHHQMVLPPEDSILLAWSAGRRSDVYVGDKDEPVEYDGTENESVIYPNHKCFGVQWHPEWMPTDSDGYKFFHDMARRVLTHQWSEFVEHYAGERHAIG